MCGNKVYTTEFWVFFNFGTNPYHTYNTGQAWCAWLLLLQMNAL